MAISCIGEGSEYRVKSINMLNCWTHRALFGSALAVNKLYSVCS